MSNDQKTLSRLAFRQHFRENYRQGLSELSNEKRPTIPVTFKPEDEFTQFVFVGLDQGNRGALSFKSGCSGVFMMLALSEIMSHFFQVSDNPERPQDMEFARLSLHELVELAFEHHQDQNHPETFAEVLVQSDLPKDIKAVLQSILGNAGMAGSKAN